MVIKITNAIIIIMNRPQQQIIQGYHKLTKMLKNLYEMPLQPGCNRKMPTAHNQVQCSELEQLISPINTEQGQEYSLRKDCRENQRDKYDLPCQRLNDLYLKNKFMENRPLVAKNAYDQSSKFTNKIEDNKPLALQNNMNSQNIRLRVSSIYEKLLQRSKQKKQIKNSPILTQATFKPKQLRKQLSRCHQSEQSLLKRCNSTNKIVKQNSTMKTRVSTNKTKIESGDCQHNRKKLQFGCTSGAKTKYEKILEQHFQPHSSHSRRNLFINAEDVRLSKICGKNSAILKLRERLNHDFSSNISKKQKQKQSAAKIYKNQKQVIQNTVSKHSNDSKNENKRHCNSISNYKQQTQKQLKQSQSQRWMSMNFHERQQRILSNRKQKQTIGKQRQIEREISPCTFKPQIINKNKSIKVPQPEKQSYLQQYYERLQRKF